MGAAQQSQQSSRSEPVALYSQDRSGRGDYGAKRFRENCSVPWGGLHDDVCPDFKAEIARRGELTLSQLVHQRHQQQQLQHQQQSQQQEAQHGGPQHEFAGFMNSTLRPADKSHYSDAFSPATKTSNYQHQPLGPSACGECGDHDDVPEGVLRTSLRPFTGFPVVKEGSAIGDATLAAQELDMLAVDGSTLPPSRSEAGDSELGALKWEAQVQEQSELFKKLDQSIAEEIAKLSKVLDNEDPARASKARKSRKANAAVSRHAASAPVSSPSKRARGSFAMDFYSALAV
eukprot:gnl/TRDRNA2_/TRDRNA2_192084_c0_seq1.p1 gnl/TRDRNA2_/TRDRNA2_192084_c0~~gnl/TRDRNA2_/TRDRNA2_192084_c0_seq1.p1  ORF type:complete len:306 (-),score=40.69 gnl/TRDRNA2_/TRDRNA2_192084_c0_seq1:27-890(-)